MSVFEELSLSEEEYEMLDLEWEEDRGHGDEVIYSYYTYVPEHTPDKILRRNQWTVGQKIEVSPNAFDEEEYECPECKCAPCECAEISRNTRDAVEKDDRQERRR